MSYITDASLSEQMHLSDREIAYRKHLFYFSDADVANLVSCRDWITSHVDEITEEFYRQQVAEPEIAQLIGDRDTLSRLKNSMHQYILELFQGYYDSEYINKRLRVGKIHMRIGVTPKLYMSAISLLMLTLARYLEQMHIENGFADRTSAIKSSLHKLILFDTQLVFDTYINSFTSEIIHAKQQVEEYAESLEQRIEERTNQLRDLSLRDPLTRLFNQGAFYENLHRELAVAERQKTCVCLIYLDLNKFKELNDSAGHQVGDKLLQAFAGALLNSIRETDIACRYGGDEFCVILPNQDITQAQMVCQRLIGNFEILHHHNITLSIGISQSGPEHFLAMSDMVKLADSRMFLSKEQAHISNGHYLSDHLVIAHPL